MNYSLSHLPVGLTVVAAICCLFSQSSVADPLDFSSGEERGQRAEVPEKERCVAFRLGKLMKTKSGAT